MTFDEMLPYVTPFAQYVPDDEAVRHLRLAAIDFCARTHVWSVELDPIIGVADQSTYELPLDDGAELVKVLSARTPNTKYEAVQGSEYRSYEGTSSGRNVISSDGTDLFIWPALELGAVLTVRVILQPTLDASEFPDELKSYAKTIADGALGTLLSMADVDWSNATAGIHAGAFEDAINTVGMEVSRGFSDATPRVEAYFF